MKKIITIVGARPQIIKASAMSRAIQTYFKEKIKEKIVHTGQHYDENMSAVFFDEMRIPQPDFNLSVGSGAHGDMTAKMLSGLEEIFLREKPDAVLVYGDTNSTLAGSLAAAKIHIPVIHVEAGLRSYDKKMPEEINRISCDHVSSMLFSPTLQGIKNLEREGFDVSQREKASLNKPMVFHCGDVMLDNSLYFADLVSKSERKISDQFVPGYILGTIHRQENTDDPTRLLGILKGLKAVSEDGNQIIIPLHPRTKKLFEATQELKVMLDEIERRGRILFIEPVGFLDMIDLELNASMVITDSGGVQKEAFFFKKPCIIMRDTTEWVEIVACGAAKLVGADANKIVEAYHTFKSNQKISFPSLFGDGQAGKFICEQIDTYLE